MIDWPGLRDRSPFALAKRVAEFCANSLIARSFGKGHWSFDHRAWRTGDKPRMRWHWPARQNRGQP